MKVRGYLILVFSLSMLAGCGGSSVQFSQNKVGAQRLLKDYNSGEQLSANLNQQIVDILGALFGTPDEPRFVAGGAEEGLLQVDNLVMAAGPVDTSRLDGEADLGDPHLNKGQGLYRQHCVHCHGVTGDGKGPTAAFLKPYPRDFTMRKFKFNSTAIGERSTDDDLHRILMNGINGTAMPSFALLDRGEIEALVDYVKYLGIRGEMERLLVELAVDADEQIEIDPAEIIGDPSDPDYDEGLVGIINKWKNATPAVEPDAPNVPLVSESSESWSDEQKQQLFASVDRGRELYYTVKANCFSCHGPTQLGDGQLDLYDEWSKELYNWSTEDSDENRNEFKQLGGLDPRPIRPRNLRLGQYRGGRRPLDIFWRIHNGIDGSGMPAATLLTHDEIWDLVNFVLWLPYEQLSHPNVELPTLDRARD